MFDPYRSKLNETIQITAVDGNRQKLTTKLRTSSLEAECSIVPPLNRTRVKRIQTNPSPFMYPPGNRNRDASILPTYLPYNIMILHGLFQRYKVCSFSPGVQPWSRCGAQTFINTSYSKQRRHNLPYEPNESQERERTNIG